MARRRGRPPHDDILTPAEWRIVHFVRHGLSNQQIADRRGISLDAVKFHVANSIAKLGLNSRRELKLWVGAPKGNATNIRGTSMNDEYEITGVGQIARSVSDLSIAVTWYGEMLGLPHLFTFGDLAFFDCGGTRLMLSQSQGEPTQESILYLRVADIHAAHRHLQAKGAEFINAPHMIHRHDDGAEEWMAFFADPDGRPLALMAVTATRSE